jgi:4-amino-4-deoxy-L-arabinose transferase-like glycosyltransferase
VTRYPTLLAMAAFGIAAVIGVLARPLLPIDETRYLAVAWGMHQSGDWMVPQLNGALYTHKPPLLFWLINIVWSVFGVSETAARLVGPAFGIGTIGATSLLARRLWPDRPGIGGRAALILAGFGVFGVYAGLTMFDAMLALSVVLGVLALVETGRTPWAWIGFGAALAFGALAKGPVVLIHLVPIALLMPVWAGARLGATLRGLGIAILVGLGLVALWLVPAVLAGGAEYRDAVLWSQHAGRIANSFAHVRPWWFFAALLPFLLWPWVWSADIWRRLAKIDLADRGVRLCMVWAGSALILFSLISGKQAHYLLPMLPAAALAIARATGAESVRAPLAGIPIAVVGLGLIAVGLVGAPGSELAALARPGWAVALVGAVLVGLAATSLWLRGTAIAGLGIGLFPAVGLLFVLAAPGTIYDPTPIARLIAPHDARGIAILDQTYHGEFTFAGRLANPVLEISGPSEALLWLRDTPGAVLLARLDRKSLPETPPEAVVLFRNRPYGIWTSPVATPGPKGHTS